TTSVAEHVGEASRSFHYGLTSSDVVDTAQALLLVRACDLLLADLEKLLAVLKRRALEHKTTPMVGRTHGVHAEPTTFGLKVAGPTAAPRAHTPSGRRGAGCTPEPAPTRTRLPGPREDTPHAKPPGPAGTYPPPDPQVKAEAPQPLAPAVDPSPTGVTPRDRH